MEEGMTDLQFRAYLRLLISRLESIGSQETPEQIQTGLLKLKKELEEDLRG
nr:hypothetical protein [uncultured Oscillibacter sp.]